MTSPETRALIEEVKGSRMPVFSYERDLIHRLVAALEAAEGRADEVKARIDAEVALDVDTFHESNITLNAACVAYEADMQHLTSECDRLGVLLRQAEARADDAEWYWSERLGVAQWETKQAEAEVTRLRAALQHIEDHICTFLDASDVWRLRDFARAALAQPKEESK